MNKIDRRFFLKTFSAAFTSAAVSPSQAVAASGNLYLNRALGIAIEKPATWFFEGLQDFERLKESQILSEAIDPVMLQLIKDSGAPLFTASSGEPDVQTFGPSCAFYAEHMPELEDEGINDVIIRAERSLISVLPDYQFYDAIPDSLINGFSGVKVMSGFTFATETQSSIFIRNVSLITLRPPFLYTLRLFDSPQNGMDATREFERIIKSIHYS